MPHVDDGQLHALLDGAFDDREARSLHAHLETCAQCATRLEQERALRERATGILAAAQPMRLATPPFDAVLQQARQRPTRNLFWAAPARLAWAATIVVALGVGWFANDLLRLDNARREQAAEGFSAPPPAAPAPPPSAEPAQPPAANDAAGAQAGTFRKENEKLVREERSLMAKERAAAEPQAAPPPRPAAVAADSSPLRSNRALNLQEVVVTGSVSPRADSSQRFRMSQTVTQQGGAGRGAPATQQQAPVQAQAQVGQQLAAKSEAVRWETMSAEQAQARTGQKVLLVPGLRVLDISVGVVGNTFQIRSAQELPGGEILTVVQQRILPVPPQPAGAAVANDQVARRAAEGERNQNRDALDRVSDGPIVVQRDGLTLTGRAAIAQDSLRALLLRAR